MNRIKLALIGLTCGALQTAAIAQVAPPPVPRDPLALPGDNLPPPMSVVLTPPAPPPPAPAAPRPPEVRAPIPGPTLEVAIAAAQAALGKCRADNLKVGVAVSDSLGVIVVGLQMEGANSGRIFFAGRKNLAAIEFGVPSSVVRDRLRANDFATLARVKPNMTLFAGSVPLIANGTVIGAIGVSGATAAQDEVCAAAGAAAVAGRF